MISEEIVCIWCADDRAPYRNLGRATLRRPGESHGYTIDFALESRDTGQVYVAEMKCELEYAGYRYLVLRDAAQLDHHKTEAFQRVLVAAQAPTILITRIAGKLITYDGAILVWGSVTPQGRAAVTEACGFHDVLSVEAIISQLRIWKSIRYETYLREREAWLAELFQGLRSIREDAS